MHEDSTIERLLASYPRQRPPLTPAHESSYVEHYRSNRSDRGGLSRVVSQLESWMHRAIAREAVTGSLLEIGAGTLNHVHYHPEVKEYDTIEPFQALWEGSPNLQRIRNMYADISEVPERPGYDCILSIAVLEHLTDLPFILARSGMLLRGNGTVRAGFPTEGGFLWGAAWRSTTGLKYRWDRGLDYGVIMRHEHVNNAKEILALLRYFYLSVRIMRFPLPFYHTSFYTAAVASVPALDRCTAVCNSRKLSVSGAASE